jgi:glycosyltransferase involved in cell wall biosynthesis
MASVFMSNKVVIFTDAWEPQVNGVVTTYKNIIANLPQDWTSYVIHPNFFKNYQNPFYKDVRLSIVTTDFMTVLIKEQLQSNDVVRFHIATEGPIGYRAKKVLDKMGIPYTTAYHTKFPEFFKAMFHIPCWVTRWYFDWFHRTSKCVMMSSQSVADKFPNWKCKVLGKGYDEYFTFSPKSANIEPMQPLLLCVGRVSAEKNIEAFCNLNINAQKVVIGDGPVKRKLEKKYPRVKFIGYKFGTELAGHYGDADCLVFPSKTDTYGIVVLESMACGTPVAAYPVDGAIDQIKNGVNGYTDENLLVAVLKAMKVSRKTTAESVKNITWKRAAEDFVKFMEK